MKTYYFLTIWLAITLGCYCQEKTENVIVSSGNTIVMDEGSLDWIIGENLIDHQVLFGDHTPEDVFTGLKEQDFLAFPTITGGPLTLVAREREPVGLFVAIYDVTNKLLYRTTWDRNPMEADLSEYSYGMYMIRIEQNDLMPLAVFKIVKE
jgi:hypothetical protein